MANIRLDHTEFYKLAEWLKGEHDARRLDGISKEVLAARARKDLGFSLNAYHIGKAASVVGVELKASRSRHIGNGGTVAAVAADLREIADTLVQLMDELGIDKAKPIYQAAQKISSAGGFRPALRAA